MSNRIEHAASSRIVELPRGEVHRIVDGRGTLIASLGGNVWITQDGDERDVVLEAGKTFRLDRQGLALVTALGPAMVAVLSDRAAES